MIRLLAVLVVAGASVKAETLEEADISVIPPSNLVYSASPKTFSATSAQTTNLSIIYLGTGTTTYSNTVAPSKVGEYMVVVTSLDPNYTGTRSQNFQILPKQLDPTGLIYQVRSLYDGTTAVQTLHIGDPIEGVFSGDDVAILRSPYNHQYSFASGWTGVFDSKGPSIVTNEGGYSGIWATISGLSLTGADSANYSLPPSVRALGFIMPSFLSWSESMGLTGTNAAKDADPDGDGITNAAEFVFAGDPHSAGENLINPEATPQGFKLRWLTRNSSGYGISVMAKTNLTSPWLPVWGEPDWIHTTVPHPTRSDASIHEIIVPWDSPYRFFKVEADTYDIDDPFQA